MIFRNEFVVCGRIVTIKELTDDTVLITLITKTTHEVFPAIICKKSMLPQCKEHSYLEIHGYAEGYYSTHAKNKDIPIHRLYATNVKVADTLLQKEFNVPGRFWKQEICTLYVSGYMDSVFDDAESNYYRYTLRIQSPETGEMVPIRVDWKKIDRHPQFKEGDKVCAVCHIRTPKKTVGTEERIFLNFSVFDMDFLE